LRPEIYAYFSHTNASQQPSPRGTAVMKHEIRMQGVGTTNRRYVNSQNTNHLILFLCCVGNGPHILMNIKVEKLETEITSASSSYQITKS
jgi:hypothetical protein